MTLNLCLPVFSLYFKNKVKCAFIRNFSNTVDSRILEILSTMQRTTNKHIADAQKQHRVVKERTSKHSSGNVILQVLGSGAEGSPKSIYIFTDNSRYLFNCGEGTQRLAHEHKMKLARLEHIFFTTVNWSNLGGLPGVALTLQDVGVPKIALHGPSGLDELFQAMRRFVILKDMAIEITDCTQENDYEDSIMTVKYVPIIRPPELLDNSNQDSNEISSESTEVVEVDNTDYYAHESSGKRSIQNTYIDFLLNQPRKEQLCSVAYICKLKSTLGTLDLQKCLDRGVKPGPMLGLLKNGQDITLPNGKVIYVKDVRTPDEPGAVFIVIDIPDVRFLDDLLLSTKFSDYQNNENTKFDHHPCMIVHFTPNDVLKNEKYQAFMKTFSPDTNHLIVNESNHCTGSIAIHRIQNKLNLLDQEIFPILKDYSMPIDKSNQCFSELKDSIITTVSNLNDKNLLDYFQNKINIIESTECEESQNNCDNKHIIPAKTFSSFHMRPKKGLDCSSELKLNILEYISETINTSGFCESLQELYSNVKVSRSQQNGSEYPKIVFFGTGSCIPNKTRNTSCIMIHTDENSCMLMDCGEGTFGQIVRFYGKDKIVDVMKNLKGIYLSHLHADHHLGLIGILQGRRRILNKLTETENPILLLAPKQIMSWLKLYDKRFERIIHEIELIPNTSFIKSSEYYAELSDSQLNRLGLKSVETCFVKHCPNSFGISIVTKQSKKITYSGDTMPCKYLVNIGQNSDLLIHEATMEDDLIGEAKRKMHSTTGQAIEIGKQMSAKFTLLTHFSQRYARLPRLSWDENDASLTNVGIAFDNMQVTFDDLSILPHLNKPLKLMFAEHYEELEFRAAKRAMKRERNKSPVNSQQLKCAPSSPKQKFDSSTEISENNLNVLTNCSTKS